MASEDDIIQGILDGNTEIGQKWTMQCGDWTSEKCQKKKNLLVNYLQEWMPFDSRIQNCIQIVENQPINEQNEQQFQKCMNEIKPSFKDFLLKYQQIFIEADKE